MSSGVGTVRLSYRRRSRSRSPPSKRRKVSSRSRSRSRSPHRSRSRSRSRERANAYRRREARESTSSRRSRSRSRDRSADRYSRSQQRGSSNAIDENQQRKVRFNEESNKNPVKEEIKKNDSDDEDEEFRRRVEAELKQQELEEKRIAEAAEKRRQLMEKVKVEHEQARAQKQEAVMAAPARPAIPQQKPAAKAAGSIDLFGDSDTKIDSENGYKAAPLTPMPEPSSTTAAVAKKPQQPLISGIGGAKVAIDLFDMKFEVETDTSASGAAADRKELGMVMAEVDPSDDTQGYYAFRIGEILFKKYQVTGFHGQGVFSSVLKAVDIDTKKEVAIKLLRNNDHMKRTGRKEMKILKSLTESDPDDKFHIVRYFGSFEDRDHLCLVLEPMDMNLRQVLKKYGADVGLNHQAIRVYAFKLIKALVLLKKNNIVHADIKPDNVLVNADRTLVKLGDLGSAFETAEAEVITELVSRFYRAPEIILGMLPTPAIDMWSLGTTLYELATGRFLIQSKNNNHHLKLIMNLKGPFPKKMIQQCSLKDEFFDEEGYFLEEYVDPVSGHTSTHRVQTPSKPTRSITKELLASYGLTSSRGSEEEKKLVTNLGDLIEQCTALDPRKRITPEQALKHPLF